jgi:opacity protein-like surface antigen
MHRFSHILLLAAGATLAAASAQAQPAGNRFYVAGAVTGSRLNKPDQTIANAPTPGATLQVENDVDFGWGGSIAIGHELGRFRIEAEIGRTDNDSDAYSAISPISITLPQKGRNQVTRYMANVYFDLSRGGIQPYVGVGIGGARARVTTFAAPARAPAAPPSQLIDDHETDFAWQLMAGAAVPVTARLAFTAQYRWFDAGTVVGKDSRGERMTREIAGHNFDLGLRLRF